MSGEVVVGWSCHDVGERDRVTVADMLLSVAEKRASDRSVTDRDCYSLRSLNRGLQKTT